jgi:hypothetical protein
VEHAVLILKVVLAEIIPDVPDSVVKAETKRHLVYEQALKFLRKFQENDGRPKLTLE